MKPLTPTSESATITTIPYIASASTSVTTTPYSTSTSSSSGLFDLSYQFSSTRASLNDTSIESDYPIDESKRKLEELIPMSELESEITYTPTKPKQKTKKRYSM